LFFHVDREHPVGKSKTGLITALSVIAYLRQAARIVARRDLNKGSSGPGSLISKSVAHDQDAACSHLFHRERRLDEFFHYKVL